MCGRLSAVSTVLLAVLFSIVLNETAEAGWGHEVKDAVLPRESLVRVYLKRESVGILVKDRFIPEPRVYEITELVGLLVNPEGHVVSYVGPYWPKPDVGKVKITVRTDDGKEHPAQPVGMDERLALALLKIDLEKDWSAGLSSESDTSHFTFVATGETDWSVAAPCVQGRSPNPFFPLVELKVSGLDLSTQSWVGSVILDLRGGFAGLVIDTDRHPFSKKLTVCQILPSHVIEASMGRILAGERVIPAGWLGVDVKAAHRKSQVARVHPGSPAEKAGLRPDDYILELDDQPASPGELARGIVWKGPGAVSRLTVERQGERLQLQATLAQRRHEHQMIYALQFPEAWIPGADPKEAVRVIETLAPPIVQMGFVVDHIPSQLARKWKSPAPGGLLVREIRAGSLAEEAGFQAGDLLFWINGNVVLSLGDVQECLESAEGGLLEIKFVRDGKVNTRKIGRQ